MKQPAAPIREMWETLDAKLGETLVADATRRIEAEPPPIRTFPSLPVFDTLDETASLQLGQPIGEGGMGLVREAHQTTLHRDVAVKTVQPARASDATNLELLHEALVTGILEHPNIVPIYSLYRDAHGAPLIVMKRVEGVAWRTCIEDPRAIPDDGATTDLLGWHLEVFDELCRAAHFAHDRGIIHRDIKPDNVMIGAHGEVYLLDWGVAVTVNHQHIKFLRHVSETRGICGTPSYMAPEMAAIVPEELGPRTDVYLLGATLYHALAGAAPHQGDTLFAILLAAYASEPAPLPDHVPEELVRIVRRAMAKRPEDRFPSAEALRRTVHDFREHRASIHLSDQAARHLEELDDAVQQGDASRSRRTFEACRTSCEHALSVWAENAGARRILEAGIARMVDFELDQRNLPSAVALLESMDEPAPDQIARVAALREELDRDEEKLEELRALERETSVTTGADSRARAAVVAWIVLTIMPLLASTQVDAVRTNLEPMFWHGVIVCAALFVLVYAFRRGLWANDANRNIARVILAFALSLPLLRYVAWHSDMNVLAALSAEAASYMVGYAALGLLSRFSPWFGVGIYSVAAVVGVHFPEQIFHTTAASNFFAMGYVAWAYHRQRFETPGNP